MPDGGAQGSTKRIDCVDRSELQQQYANLLNPDVLRPRLLVASVYIAGFESLRDAIISQPRSLFRRVSPAYNEQVLARHPKNPTIASLLWFKDAGAIDAQDLEMYDRVRQCRNQLAHELLDIVSSKGLPPGLGDRFAEMIALLRKIDVWWLLNFELDTDPEWDGKEINEKEILPGRQIALQMLYDVALGNDEQSRYWYRGFRERVEALGLWKGPEASTPGQVGDVNRSISSG